MTFEDAMKQMSGGTTMRRAAWHPFTVVFFHPRTKHATIDLGDGKRVGPWICRPEDKEATDWEACPPLDAQ